jgi:hypothetical protein
VDFERELGNEPPDPLPPADDGDELLIKGVPDFLQDVFGDVVKVYHEEESRFVHVDVHRFEPDEEDGFHPLVTTGMSQKPMVVPPEIEEGDDLKYAELMLFLPERWPMEWDELKKGDNWWPIQMLINLARFPHENEVWLWSGHTVANRDYRPFVPGTGFCAAFVVDSMLLPEECVSLDLADGRHIELFSVVFIYKEEHEFLIEHGPEDFMNKVMDSGLAPLDFFVLTEGRINICA